MRGKGRCDFLPQLHVFAPPTGTLSQGTCFLPADYCEHSLLSPCFNDWTAERLFFFFKPPFSLLALTNRVSVLTSTLTFLALCLLFIKHIDCFARTALLFQVGNYSSPFMLIDVDSSSFYLTSFSPLQPPSQVNFRTGGDAICRLSALRFPSPVFCMRLISTSWGWSHKPSWLPRMISHTWTRYSLFAHSARLCLVFESGEMSGKCHQRNIEVIHVLGFQSIILSFCTRH